MARTRTLNGTEKDSQEGLKMESSRQRETGKAKNEPEKNLRGRLKKMELTLGTAERESKDRIPWRKRNCCIILDR